MEKKKNWFNLVKKIFGSEKKKITEKKPPKEKKWRRPWFFSKARLHCPPAIKAPSPPLTKTLSEVESEQNKHALAVAVATAAAAEAAVAAAQAAAEIVRLTGNARLSRGSNEIGLRATIKIQAVFRGFLARKALRALKGLVRLQALVRGWVVRKQATATLKSMQSLIKIQSQICATRVRKAEEIRMCEQINQLEENCRRKWDSSVLSKEELEAMFLSRQEASIKRDRALQYASSHRERRNAERSSSSTLTESEQDKLNWRWSWLENWMDSQNIHGQNQIAEDSLDSKHTDEVLKTQLRSKEFKKSEQIAGSRSPISLPRKSFHQFRGSLIRDDESFSSSPTVPNYMASTESAKAKERSISTPKQRPGTIDTYSCHNSSPSKNRFPSFPSVNSDESINKLSKSIGYQPRSPLLKGLSGPIKSQRTPTKDLSLDSECSFFTRDQSTALG